MSDFDLHFPAAVQMDTNWEIIHEPHQDGQGTTNNKDHVWQNIGGNYYQCMNCRQRKEIGDELDD